MSMNRRAALKAAFLLGAAVRPLGAGVSFSNPLVPRVRDEFGHLKSVLVHDARNAVDIDIEDVQLHPPEYIAEHPETRLVRRQDVIDQQHRFCDLLDRAGVHLHFPDVLEDAPGQIFTRDPSFVIHETLFLGSLRDEHRQHEPAGLLTLCQHVRHSVDLHEPGAHIEGGDLFLVEKSKTLLVGTHRHTNALGIRALRAHLAGDETRIVRVPHRALHLDCCLAPLPDGNALYVPGKLPEKSVEAIREFFPRLDPVDRREGLIHLAANLFWLDPETVVSNSAAVRTNRELRERGWRVIPMEFSHITGMWGSFRCVTCPLVREA